MHQTQVWAVVVVTLLGALSVDAGYYKSRPPPPAKLHYGHKPPPGYFSKPPSPPHYRRPIPLHVPPRNPIRPPPRPYIVKPTPPTPPPFPPASWSSHNSFRAPVVKETFHTAPLSYTPNYIHDDDKGPIHTIPAPNLGPADRPHDFHAQQGPAHEYHLQQGPSNSALDAVLSHGQAVQSHPVSGYQVTEDPSAYKPYSNSPSYFAPDPDPSLPTIEVTKTLDPHSLPSNGMRPLDVYQQEQADQQQYQQYPDGQVSNSLSPQDLYGLLNQAGGAGAWSQQPVMTPELYQQYLQAASALTQQPLSYSTQHSAPGVGVLYHRQHQQQHDPQFSQNFRPQFETFNYNEQTQESAHGSDSFPSASSVSMSVGVKRAAPKDSLNSIPSEYKKLRGDMGEEDVLSNQVDFEEEKTTLDEKPLSVGYYTTLPDKQTAETLATLSAAGNINNQIMKSPYAGGEQQHTEQQQTADKDEDSRQTVYRTEVSSSHGNQVDDRQQYYMNQEPAEETSNQSDEHAHKEQAYDYSDDEIMDPSDKDQRSNVRLQNGVRMYEVRGRDEKETQQEEPNYDDAEEEEEKEEGDNVGEKTRVSEERVPNYNAHQKQLPFGAKLRPKRV